MKDLIKHILDAKEQALSINNSPVKVTERRIRIENEYSEVKVDEVMQDL